MAEIIVYGSAYGSAKRYADKLSKLTGITAVDDKCFSDSEQYRTIIYFGGLYAGVVKGLKQTAPQILQSTRLILITVGLADTNNTENTNCIKQSLKKQLSEKQYRSAAIFYLRGAIDYSQLNFKHKTMMALLFHTVKNQAPHKQTEDTKALIETYNPKIDFVNFEQLFPIFKILKQTER